MIAKATTVQQGTNAEILVLEFLKQQGLTELTRNFRARTGEIDLIMLEKSIIVFVEVRSRKNNRFMDPVETIDNRKVQKILRTSRLYLQRYPAPFDSCRFDIVTLTGNISAPRLDWIKNAFCDE
jgi:putative endonuclease